MNCIKETIWKIKEFFKKKLLYLIIILCFLPLYVYLFFKKQKEDKKIKERIAVIILSWKRPLNLPFVIYGIRRQSYINDVIIFHNHPSKLKIPNCHNIFSNKNKGCYIRHEIASKLKKYDYFLFVDDDLLILKDLKKEIIPAIKKYAKKSIIGFYGKNINMKNQSFPYTQGKEIRTDSKPEAVDIVKGRFHIISKEGIKQIINKRIRTKGLFSEDDIHANIILQMKNKKPSYVMPLKNKMFDLPDKFARENRKNHDNLRNLSIREAINLGWRSFKK